MPTVGPTPRHLAVAGAFGYPSPRGEMAEWLKAAVSKTVNPQGFGGSNPSLSARTFQEGGSAPLLALHSASLRSAELLGVGLARESTHQ